MRRILIVMLMVGMLHFGPNTYPQDKRSSSEGRRLHRVSLIRVIANPEKFDGEHIRVIGFLGGASLDDGPGLFVSDRDGLNGVLSNAVNLDVSYKITDMYGKYVIVQGLYHAPPPGGDFNGYIDNVFELRPLHPENTRKRSGAAAGAAPKRSAPS